MTRSRAPSALVAQALLTLALVASPVLVASRAPAAATFVYVGNAESSVPTEKQPRGFAIDTSGRYMLAAGQLAHAMSSYAIDQTSGKLTKLKEPTMPRMDPLHEVEGKIRHLCEEAERQSGTSASTRTYARNPAVVKALAAFRGTLAREGTIDPSLRELVRLKIAALNACRY